jgi:hypothetical protein
MSLAQKVAASKKAAREEQEQKARQEAIKHEQIAMNITKAKKQNKIAFPSNEIESLVEIAFKQVALNFTKFPEMEGVTDENITK